MELTCRALALRGDRQWGRRGVCQIVQSLLWHLSWQAVALLNLRPGYPKLTAYHFLLLRYLRQITWLITIADMVRSQAVWRVSKDAN